MDDLKTALDTTKPDDFQVVADLSEAYHHVRLHPSQYNYFGFKAKVDGVLRYFVYVVLPFGLSPSSHVLT